MVLTCVIILGGSITHQRYPNIPWANTSLDGAIAMNSIRLHWIGIMFGCSRIISVAILSLPEQIVAAQLRVIGLEADGLVTLPHNFHAQIPTFAPIIGGHADLTAKETRTPTPQKTRTIIIGTLP